MKTRTGFAGLLLGFVSAWGVCATAQAGSSAWAVDADGNWDVPGNWGAGVPGSTSLLNSTDVATFGLGLTGDRAVTVDTGRNIGGITFGNTSDYAYTLGGGSLLLSNGGVIQNTADNGAHTDVIASPIIIQGNGGAATFNANTVVTNSVLRIEGGVSGVAAAGKTNTLTLTGSTLNPSENVVAGMISDGSGGGRVAVVKSGYTNSWVLGGANTFSGGVNIQGGILILEHGSALGSGNVTQAALGALALRGDITVAGKNITLGGGTPSAYGSLDSFGGTNTWTGTVTLAGAGPRLNCASGKLIITGNVVINHASGNSTLGGFADGEISGVISGVSSKTLFRSSTDTGTWYLLGTNTYAGNTTCANGTLAINNDSSLGVKTAFSATGLTLGGAATRGILRALENVAVTNLIGITLHGGGGRIDTDEGATLRINGVIINRTATPLGTLIKGGAGTLVLATNNTFSTEFEVAEGTAVLAHANALKGLASPPKLKIDGTLDLGGFSVTNPVLAGAGGTVSNGTLTVTAETTPGGAGAVAALAVPATTLGGTLTADVETDGTCDRLDVKGALTLSGLSLNVVDPGKLNKQQVYTLALCTGGTLSGTFASHNLPEGWWVDYSGNQIRLNYFTGMIMRVQ